MKAVIMAGGFGTRIQPLTNSIPKPMLKVMNIPMMENILFKLKNSGINEIVILLYYKPEVITNYFKDGKKYGVKIHYVLPDRDYGTAGAVKFAEEYLDETFIIISGDLVTDFDLKEIFQYHQNKNSKLTITLTSVENPLEFGVVITDENGKIQKFLEKPSWAEVFSDTINTGIYVIEPEILEYIPKGENFDFSKNLFPLLMEKDIDLMGYYAKGYWRDVGNPNSYREVHKDIFNGLVDFDFREKFKKEFNDGIIYFQGKSSIDNSVEIIDKVVIGDNVKIGKNVTLHNVVIGNNVVIKDNSNIKNSIIWDDVIIKEKVKLNDAVICNSSVIERGVEAKYGLVMAENCKIGEFAKIEKDITIWPNKVIEPASIVTDNVIWQKKYKNSLFEEGRIEGTVNVELTCDNVCKIAQAFGSQLPSGSTVVVGRDELKESLMFKNAFIGGLLATGINVVDLDSICPPVLRFSITENNFIGGVYFGRTLLDITKVYIAFFNEYGLRIKKDSAKKIEKSFFKEDFRREDITTLGIIKSFDKDKLKKDYVERIEKIIDHHIIKTNSFKIAIDVMHGVTRNIFPQVLSKLDIEHFLINSYKNEVKLSNISALRKESKKTLSKFVTCFDYKIGFMIYPHGQRLTIVTENGKILDKVEALMMVLYLVNEEAKSLNKKLKIFLPIWAPDFIDEYFSHLIIDRGKYYDFDFEKLKEYYLIATIDGNFAFSEFRANRDAVFATLKISELLSKYEFSFDEIKKFHFYYKTYNIKCPQSKKGYIMRKFLELNKKKESIYGVKIFEDEKNWILMIPDQYMEKLNIYIQADNIENGEKIYKKYTQMIESWIKE